MPTTIEITGHRIRLCRYIQGRIAQIESFAVERGTDPIVALAEAPLPNGLGRVRVMLHHPDLLLKTMVQPVCPADRMQRIIEFELKSMFNEEMDTLCAWHLVRVGGASDDMRVLVSVAKRTLLKQLQFALGKHGGKLASLIHPGIGLFNCYLEQTGSSEQKGDVVLVDIGGAHVHTVMVHDGELLFIRTNSPGQDELVAALAELRGVVEEDARSLVKRLTANTPDDIRERITRLTASIASTISTNVRFMKAQFKLQKFEADAIYLSGAGGQLPGLVGYLKDRVRTPVRVLNPFASRTGAMGGEMDGLAELPSPWCPVIGCSLSPQPELDVLQVVRDRQRAFWTSHGALRVAAVVMIGLLVLAMVQMSLAQRRLGAVDARLRELNPKAQQTAQNLDNLVERKELAERRLRFLAGIRSPSRVMQEFLTAISATIDPARQKVSANKVTVNRINNDTIQIELKGVAEPGDGKRADAVLQQFESDLLTKYPVLDPNIGKGKVDYQQAQMGFSWNLLVKDHAIITTVPISDPAPADQR